MTPAATRDALRRQVADRELTAVAVTHLSRDALGRIDLAALAPVKVLLKRFFSSEPWTDADDRSLASLVGAGDGWWSHALDADTRFEFGWRDGAFRLELGPERAPADSLADTFAGEVIPEATPNPRTIRFVTGPIHEGPSRWYESAAGVDDPRAAQLFAEFDDVANVLVGPDFVAVGLRRPDRWEELLAPVLRAVTTEFTSSRAAGTAPSGAPTTGTAAARGPSGGAAVADARSDSVGRVERAWQELGRLRPGDPADLRRIVDAVSADDAAVRQVAARLLVGADLDTSVRAWSLLLDDPSRGTRRACVDAMVDDGRPELRRLLERALLDADAWTRWKALRGIVDLGVEPSRVLVTPLAEDPDFRVRLEAAAALRSA